MSKIVVLTDLGTFKAFKLEQDAGASRPRLRVVQENKSPLGDDRVKTHVTDQAGNFSKGQVSFAAINDGTTGERHNICLENDRRSVKDVAQKMTELLSDREVDACYFAASNEINDTILKALSREARSKITKNLHCNLVNAKHEEILSQFGNQ